MDWKGRRQSDNIEDERGSSPMGGGPLGGGGFRFPGGGLGGGGLSFRTIIVLVVIFLVLRAMGVDVIGLLQQSGALTGGSSSGSGYQQSDNSGGTVAPANDEMKQFVATVLADTEDTWTGIFKSMGQTYTDPKLVLFSGSFPSACGTASAATGPFYCPSDQKVYLDMAFFQQMKDQFGASGDFAQAYVIAHEVGHHVQDQLGILPKFNRARQTMSEVDANKMSVRIELQADCFAGIWGKFTQQKGILQQGDLEEALNAAQQIGDDTLQKRSQGYVVPDSFNHGTSAQRMKWFKQGFDSGKLSDCDTLNNPV